jgi:hypothetical protein
MPPKKTPAQSQAQSNFEELSHAELVAKLIEVTATVTNIDKKFSNMDSRFDRLEKLWTETKAENKALKDALQEKEREICNIRERLNEQEQYTRSWCVRVLNMKLPQADSTDPYKVMQNLYDRLLLPIFRGALEKGIIRAIPPVDQILETAHILPCKPGTIPPIIARFYSRNIRAMIFRLKKEFAPRSPPEPTSGARSRTGADANGAGGAGKLQFLLFEDLTRPTFSKMRAISQHESVENCWSVSGQLRYKLKDNPNIFKVKTVFASVEQILASQK